MHVVRRPAVLAPLVLVLSLGLAGCGGADDGADRTGAGSATAASTVEDAPSVGEIRAAIEAGATVLDVRTPEEFAAGHLRGARNLDFTGPAFERRLRKLDKQGGYVLYCASGNRAGQALEVMREQGFADVMNAGGYDDLAASGFAVAGLR